MEKRKGEKVIVVVVVAAAVVVIYLIFLCHIHIFIVQETFSVDKITLLLRSSVI
jgi:hypothetical protein